MSKQKAKRVTKDDLAVAERNRPYTIESEWVLITKCKTYKETLRLRNRIMRALNSERK